MSGGTSEWVLVLPEGDVFAHLLSRKLARPGRAVVRAPALDAFEGTPILAIVDLALPEAAGWLARLKFGRGGRVGRDTAVDPGRLVTAVLGLSSRKPGESGWFDPKQGIRVRADQELCEPFTADDAARAAEELAGARAARPGLRTVALEYAPDLERQRETAGLIDRLLETCGLPEMPRFMFGCGVQEALDNARLHGSRPGEPSDKARVWFEADAGRVTVAVSDNGGGIDPPQMSDNGETPIASARRRNASGKPGGLGLHMMRRSADEVHYEPQRKRVMLIKRF